MANTQRTQGLRPIDQPFGNIRANWYQAVTGTAIFMYQPVGLDANGRIIIGAANTAQIAILGTAIGFADDSFCPLPDPYLKANPSLSYTANSAGLVRVLVVDDPGQYYVIEEDTGGSALTQASIGLGCGFRYIGASSGNTTSGISGAQLYRTTASTVMGGGTLRLIKKWDKLDNELGNYCKWIVKIDNHQYTATSAGNFI